MLSWQFVHKNQASASIVVPMTLKDLTEQADLIVLGISSETTSVWDSDRKNIVTYITLVPERCFKVTECPAPIRIRQLGGTVEGVTMTVAGAPKFYENERLILFLENTPSSFYRVIGLSQGKFSVIYSENEGKNYVIRDLRHLKFLKRRDKEFRIQEFTALEAEVSLEDFLEKIRSHLEAQ